MTFAVFDYEGNLVSTEPTVEAAVARAEALPAVKEVIVEVDPTVGPTEGRVANAGARTPIAALRSAGLTPLSEDDVMRLSVKEAHAKLKSLAPGIQNAETPSGFYGRWLLGSTAKMKKADVRGELRAWVQGLALLPHAKPFDLPEDTESAAVQRPVQQRILQVVGQGKHTFCLGSSQECRSACLVYTGQNEITDAPRIAKRYKANMLLLEPAAFARMLVAAVEAHVERCKSGDSDGPFEPFFRLNVFSDLPWELLIPWFFDRFKGVWFYDYTKVPGRTPPANYHLSFSYSGRNDSICRQEATRGLNPVFVFGVKKKESKPEWLDVGGLVLPVIDGDKSDVRPRDPALKAEYGLDLEKPAVVGLYYKVIPRLDLRVDISKLTSFVVPAKKLSNGVVILPGVPRFDNAVDAKPETAVVG